MNYGMFRYLRLGAASILAGMFAFVWWCVLYPELCFPQDTYEVVYVSEDACELDEGKAAKAEESGEGRTAKIRGLDEAECYEMLHADEEQIVIKSRLLEWLEKHIN